MVSDILLLLVVAFAAGALNAAAGGGTFLTLPALMLTGVPPVAANATGTVALLPGYVASVFGFREELAGPHAVPLAALVVAGLSGGVLGALLLLATPDVAFRRLIPWLMLAATLWFALWPLVERRLGRRQRAGIMVVLGGVFLVSVYGGYFNGGLGIVLLALFGALGFANLNEMNALKNLLSAVLTTVAIVVYAAGGQLFWTEALVMMPLTIAGGYWGARLARRVPAPALRAGITLVGAGMTAGFFLLP